MKLDVIISFTILILAGHLAANDFSVTVRDLKGEAEVRKGLDENWTILEKGMELKDIDTILTGKESKITLDLPDGSFFVLEENSVLDVGDLRIIQEKELFLYLMSNKIDKLTPVKKTKLQIGNVSVVHGSNARLSQDDHTVDSFDWLMREKNGAKALFKNELYTNTIVKMSQMMMEYDSIPHSGEMFYFMGRSFEAIDKKGQAIDHYEKAIEISDAEISKNLSEISWFSDAKNAIDRLKKE